MFTDKVKQSQQIILIEEEEIILDKKRVAKKLNTFHINAVPNLNIKLDNNINYVVLEKVLALNIA